MSPVLQQKLFVLGLHDGSWGRWATAPRPGDISEGPQIGAERPVDTESQNGKKRDRSTKAGERATLEEADQWQVDKKMADIPGGAQRRGPCPQERLLEES